MQTESQAASDQSPEVSQTVGYLFRHETGEMVAILTGVFKIVNHTRAAACHFRKSLQLAEIKSEQAFLAKRLQACEEKVSSL